jgi:glycosyl transferase family 25
MMIASCAEVRHETGMKLYAGIINLAHRVDRRESMRQQMEAQGLDLPFFEAVFGADLAPDALDKWVRPMGPFGPQGHGDRACTASHFELMIAFLKSDADWLFALEDDAKLSPELSLWVNDLSWIPDDADVVKLESWVDKRVVLALDRTCKQHLSRGVTQLSTHHSGTAGFLVSRAHAERVVQLMGHVGVPIDHLLFNPGISKLARRAVIYQVQPSLIRQDTAVFGSDISASRKDGGTKRTILSKLKRAWSDIRPAPRVLWGLATRRMRLDHPSYKDRCL